MSTAGSQPTDRTGDQLPCRTDWTIALTATSRAATGRYPVQTTVR